MMMGGRASAGGTMNAPELPKEEPPPLLRPLLVPEASSSSPLLPPPVPPLSAELLPAPQAMKTGTRSEPPNTHLHSARMRPPSLPIKQSPHSSCHRPSAEGTF